MNFYFFFATDIALLMERCNEFDENISWEQNVGSSVLENIETQIKGAPLGAQCR